MEEALYNEPFIPVLAFENGEFVLRTRDDEVVGFKLEDYSDLRLLHKEIMARALDFGDLYRLDLNKRDIYRLREILTRAFLILEDFLDEDRTAYLGYLNEFFAVLYSKQEVKSLHNVDKDTPNLFDPANFSDKLNIFLNAFGIALPKTHFVLASSLSTLGKLTELHYLDSKIFIEPNDFPQGEIYINLSDETLIELSEFLIEHCLRIDSRVNIFLVMDGKFLQEIRLVYSTKDFDGETVPGEYRFPLIS